MSRWNERAAANDAPYAGTTQIAVDDTRDRSNLRDQWHVLVRRKWSLLLFASTVMGVTALAAFLSTPIYRAGTLLQIDREPVKVVQYQDITPMETGDANDFYRTQYELLQSRSLARRVIDQLKLREHPVFAKTASRGALLSALTAWSDEEDASDPDERWIDLFLDGLNVEPVKNSRLVRLYYESPDPALAARIVNALSEHFIEMNLARRMEASAYAKHFLEERLAQTQARLEHSEERLVEFARENEILDLEEEHGINVQRLQEMNLALAEAERARIQAEAAYRSASRAGASSTPAILQNPLIQQLKQYKASLEAEYRDKLKVFKPDYPAMQQLQSQIDEIRRQIEREVADTREALKVDYETALDTEHHLRTRVGELMNEVLTLQDRSIQYNIFRREVATNRELYDGLLQRMKEVGVAGGISANNIAVIDAAEVPDERYRPDIPLSLLIASAIGLFGGVGLAFLLDHLDDTVKHPQDLERRTRLPVFGAIPEVRGPELAALGVLSHSEPTSGLAEAYRSVRTSLLFATPAGAPKVLLFTSPSPAEGKTTSALNVAISFTQMDRKVLLIDTDLRNPSLHRALGAKAGKGLTNYLVGQSSPPEITQGTGIPGLFLIPSGPIAPNPAELLSNDRMAALLALAAERFDHVILDGPPVLGLADALVVANQAHGTLVVSEAGVTRAIHLQAALNRLESAKARVIGGLLSKMRAGEAGYGYYASYYYYRADAGDRSASMGTISP